MLDEEGQEPGFVVLDFGETGGDVRGYEVRAAAASREGERFLEPWDVVLVVGLDS